MDLSKPVSQPRDGAPNGVQSRESALDTNKVLRNTYALLSMTLVFSAVMAAVSMAVAPSPIISLVCTFGALGLLMFVLPKYQDSTAGIGLVFAATGMLGFGLGPVLNAYMSLGNGGQIIGTAMGGTGVIFLALSAYVLTTKKDFTFMGGFLFVGLFVVFGAAILNIFMAIPALALAVSAGIILLMSGFILFDTSRILNGSETNYIMATVSLYIAIFNIFTSLLQILGIMGGDD